MRRMSSLRSIGGALAALLAGGCAESSSGSDLQAVPDAMSDALSDGAVDALPDLACLPSPLADYCGGPCHDHSALIAALQAGGCLESPSFPELGPQSGTCGAFTYVLYSPHGLDVTVEYFDAQGVLVGVKYRSDTTEFCGRTSFEIDYGSVPRCDPVRTDGGSLHCGLPDAGLRG
jgi:hypothetical protein